MLNIVTVCVGEEKTNCYIIYQGEEKEAVIIDPGDDAGYIADMLLQKNLVPKVILLTHGHYDHLRAAEELSLIYNAKIYVDRKDKFLIERTEKVLLKYSKDNKINKISVDFFGEKEVELGKIKLTIIPTPGHTPGSVSFYLESTNIAFIGDLCFSDGSLGEYRHPYSRKNNILASIKSLLKISKNLFVYPGHGEEFFLCNKFNF